jgi:hypothetical protein
MSHKNESLTIKHRSESPIIDKLLLSSQGVSASGVLMTSQKYSFAKFAQLLSQRILKWFLSLARVKNYDRSENQHQLCK